MDPLSQAVVGATAALCACRKREWVRPAVIAGVVGGMLPDLDIFIRSDTDPLMFVQFHRHFTHALAFAPIGGLLAALLCWPALKKHMPFRWIYWFALLGYATHGPLDAMTNYGTHLFWPFTERRESWSIISIIDPIFTLTVLALCVLAFKRRATRFGVYAALFACCYWSFGYAQREAATGTMHALAASRGHSVERSEVKPSFANLIVWRAQYEYDGHYYIQAVRVLPGATPHVYEGGSVEAFDVAHAQPPLASDSLAYRDFTRFAFFSDGWVARVPGQSELIGDMRFATLPNAVMPLWAIRLPDDPKMHVAFINLHQSRVAGFGPLWEMVKGEGVP